MPTMTKWLERRFGYEPPAGEFPMIVERLRGATLVQARLHTGRTHQIRVHFQHLGFPLVGDETYGKKQNARLRELTNYIAPRQMLHARELSFTDPRTRRIVRFEAPWPEDFAAAVKALRKGGEEKK